MTLILFNKPFQVMSQFSEHPDRKSLADYLDIPGIYPSGRLDADSEGLMLLTDDGELQHAISHPDSGKVKTYLAQVEGTVDVQTLARLRSPIDLGDFTTKPCKSVQVAQPAWLWPRVPAIRERKNTPTNWITLSLTEGKNRQVRRMTAAVGLPTLRLIRVSIGPFTLVSHPLLPGEWREVSVAEWLGKY